MSRNTLSASTRIWEEKETLFKSRTVGREKLASLRMWHILCSSSTSRSSLEDNWDEKNYIFEDVTDPLADWFGLKTEAPREIIVVFVFSVVVYVVFVFVVWSIGWEIDFIDALDPGSHPPSLSNFPVHLVLQLENIVSLVFNRESRAYEE